MYKQNTYVMKNEGLVKHWHLIDANGKTVGRLATEITNLLRGKYNPKYTPNIDSGDFVVVINAEKVVFTGNKLTDKIYYTVTPYVGGTKSRTAKVQLEKHPELVLLNAVKGMLPKNTLGRKQLTKLKVYAGEKHNNQAQNPVAYEIKTK